MKIEIIKNTQVYWWAWFAIRFLVWFKSPAIEHKGMMMDWVWFLRNLRNPYIKSRYGVAFCTRGNRLVVKWGKYKLLGGAKC